MNEKSLLRRKLRDSTAQLGAEEKFKIDAKIAENFLNSTIYKECEVLFLFIGIRNEINTDRLIKTAESQGKIIGLPKTEQDGIMNFYRYNGSLIAGRYGIPEPDGSELLLPNECTLIVVPGLAFDRSGYRLGQGGGYYDRYLSRYSGVKTVGLSRKTFFFEILPRAWNDLPVDFVITEDSFFDCKKNGASFEAP